MTSPIADYALIGDGRTAAMVARNGSIDFLCLPNFDSDACFAAMLGDQGNGCWQIAPTGFVTAVERRYRGDTLILETDHSTDSGAVRVTDFMPWHDGEPMVVRIVEGLSGEVEMASLLRPRFDYGRVPPWMRPFDGGLCADAGSHQLVLHAPCALEAANGDARATFSVRKGERLVFALSYAPSYAELPKKPDTTRLLKQTDKAWRDWIGRFDAPDRWGAPLKRSLLTLKALIDRRTGGLVAAATMGLPEVPGGAMNWDYRYCWLRDATFTLTALLNAGFADEAVRWRDWILRAIAGDPKDMRIMYRIDGGRRLQEYEATWLKGHGGAKPVLVGNAASDQTQLDVYGELIDSFHVGTRAGVERTPRDIAVEIALIEYLEGAWDKPGADIWESRGDPGCYTYSQAMAWVGINHFVESDVMRAAAGDELVGRMRGLRTQIHQTVCERGYSAGAGHFVQRYDGETLDASLLLLPLVGFLPADDPRIAGTIAAVERELMEGGLVRRKAAKGDGHDEGVFLACSCWLADCLAMQGRCDEAATMLDRVIGLSNDVGLLSEEFHVPTRRLIGNVPQALTHLGVVNSALFLSRPVVQRGAV
ncbi:glycoside hydrolase family 15 protein [Sphingomonas sp. S-NIH.Pt15_0812]|uniref:glycoside hydrolase family 15 protein n=1 Tax=Sphingomonas sp. S-NIH.Pt15_0812 TaxID=1920129 RepID=UPI000F7E6894|nr:glycoside hydrolase family 15 protein [Sphingomonas sp. S-NIH.Pt15_0812]RSU47692.1 glycoside hydrolase family 15 protein [Sphingomonas sp. S-NIH.Pt15_0812]